MLSCREWSNLSRHSLDIKADTSVIILNMVDLLLGRVVLSSTAYDEQEPWAQDIDIQTERVTLRFTKTLPAGSKAILSLLYHGELTGSLSGYYRSNWARADSATIPYALTQFEVYL